MLILSGCGYIYQITHGYDREGYVNMGISWSIEREAMVKKIKICDDPHGWYETYSKKAIPFNV